MRTKKLHVALLAVPVLVTGLVSGCSQGAAGSAATPRTASAVSSAPAGVATALARLEERHDRRLGLYMLDTGTGRAVAYHAGERFGFCSTSKALLAGVLLKRFGDARLDKVIRYGKDDLQDYSPITEKHVGTGMTLRALIKAALQYSDNTAANLMFEQVGGPPRVQRALRGLGDRVTNVNRV